MDKKARYKVRLKIGHFAIIIILMMGSAFSGLGQNHYMEAGFPFLQNFSAKEYAAHSQNFAIAQDHRGIMYFGNFSGILEYDGNSWNTILTPNISKVSSLIADSDGRIYVGARGEFGYLQPNSLGVMEFISLSNKASVLKKNIGDIIHVYSINKKIFFISKTNIFIYHDEKISVIEPPNEIISAFLIDETLFCQIKEIGLCKLENKTLNLVKGGEIFSGAIYIKSILKHTANQYIIASDIQGLYLMNDDGITLFHSDAQNYLINNKLSCGVKLRDDSYAFGTKRGGIVNIYPDGILTQVLTKKAGLQNDYINNLFANENGLWAALNNGLARIETPSPLNYHDENSGLKGGVLDLTRYHKQLYIATYNGLYFQDRKTALFKAIPEINSACWSILPFTDHLLAASSNGLFQISNGNIRQLSKDFSLFLYHYKKDKNLLFVGTDEGISIFKKDAGIWKEKESIKNIDEEIREIGEDKNGKLWFVSTANGIFSYEPIGKHLQAYTQNDSLPSLFGNHICKLNQELVFSTLKGLYKYDEKNQIFDKYQILGSDSIFNNKWFYRVFEDNEKNIWTINGDETNLTLYQREKNNKLIKNQIPFMQISDFVVWDIFFGKNDVIWLGGSNGLIRYQKEIKNNYKKTFHTLIRSVYTNNDSILFGGSFIEENNFPIPKLKDGSNISFTYSAVSYNYKEKIQYKYLLNGFDKTWSEWTTAEQKEYTNLSGGKYTFHIKAKDIFNNVSQETIYEFEVSTPWQEQWWAYIIYFVLIATLVFLIVIWRAQKLVKEKKALENLVEERTAEILEQKEEIEKRQVKIEEEWTRLEQQQAEKEKERQVLRKQNCQLREELRRLREKLEKIERLRNEKKEFLSSLSLPLIT